MTDAMTDATTPAHERRRRGLLFPALLIALGTLFLLGNLGYIPPVSWRAIVALWPLLLIVGGIEMLVARRQPYLALAIEIVVVALGIALVMAQLGGLFATAGAGSTSVEVPRDGARSLALRLTGGAGSYALAGGASALVEARSEGGEIEVRTDRAGDRAEVRVQPAGTRADGGPRFDLFRFGGFNVPRDVNVRIAGDVPASIRVSGGAGDFAVDMRDLTVTDVRVETGASNLRVVLPTPRGEVPVRIQAGAAGIEIEVPEGVEARVTTSGGAVSVTTSNPRIGGGAGGGIAVVNRSTETAGYASAKDRVTVTIVAGASSISIR